LIRRVWTVKRRETRKAATIAADIGKAYEEAGQRSATSVYFNGGTLPGEKDRVYMQWTAEVIGFYELITPAKAQDYDT
jgi:hypothetical protein